MRIGRFVSMLCMISGFLGCAQIGLIDGPGPQIHEKSVAHISRLESEELFILYGETHVVWRKNKLKAELLSRGLSEHDLLRIELGDVIGMREGAAFASFGRPLHRKTTLLATETRETFTFRTSSKGYFDHLKVLVVNGIVVKIDR